MVSEEDEMVIMKRTESAMTRAIHDIKLLEKRSSQELKNWLGFEKT